MARGRRSRGGEYGEFWPGYIDVLSTLLLVLAGRAEAGLPLAVACAMVAAGAAIARLRPSRASR